jgi:hypothetical protein
MDGGDAALQRGGQRRLIHVAEPGPADVTVLVLLHGFPEL